MKKNQSFLKQIWHFFKIEFWIVVIINCIIMGLTYFFKGIKGVEKIIDSLNDQYDGINIGATCFSLLIGVLLWILYRFFNFKSKSTLRAISEGLVDTLITLLRLAGGVLLSFTSLYLLVEGMAKVLIAFTFYGVLVIGESAFLVWLKYKMYSRPDRPFKN